MIHDVFTRWVHLGCLGVRQLLLEVRHNASQPHLNDQARPATSTGWLAMVEDYTTQILYILTVCHACGAEEKKDSCTGDNVHSAGDTTRRSLGKGQAPVYSEGNVVAGVKNKCEECRQRRTALFFISMCSPLGRNETQHFHLTCHFVWRRTAGSSGACTNTRQTLQCSQSATDMKTNIQKLSTEGQNSSV